MEQQSRELVFTPKPLLVEIPNATKLRDMFSVGGKIKYDDEGNPSSHDLKVTPINEQIERFLSGQKDAFPKGGVSSVNVSEVKVTNHKGNVDDPWNALTYEFVFSSEKTDENDVKVWALSYRVMGTAENMKLIPAEFDFTPLM